LLSIVAALGQTYDDTFGIFATVQGLVTEKFLELMERPNFEKQFKARAALGAITF
jgi:hypothetical protein